MSKLGTFLGQLLASLLIITLASLIGEHAIDAWKHSYPGRALFYAGMAIFVYVDSILLWRKK